MDSVFNDIEFLMGNMKQETPNNTNERAEPLADGVQNNDTEQLAMSTYMTDFILDYINRSLKEEETQPENNETEGSNEEESVEDLIARAENMIRENMRQNEQIGIPVTSAAVMNNEWMQQLNSQLQTSEDNPIDSQRSANPAPVTNSSDAVMAVPVEIEVPDVISVDTDSDDEVIFVNHHKPATAIPVIDLSDHVDVPSNNSLHQSSIRRESRKRSHRPDTLPDTPTVDVLPPERPQEKQFRHNCAICLEDVKAPHSTTCGHIYCGECIKNALKIFKKCPSCNKKLKMSNVHPIYL